MCQENTSILKKGNKGEDLLTKWFQENGMAYFPIRQDVQAFMHAFAQTMKRPDFFVLLKGLGMLAVDAKNYRIFNGYFSSNKTELCKAISFEIITKMPFWFAYSTSQMTEQLGTG